ncbi:Abcb10 [Symbiodinium natans]|uniref:Abcb10 protein n=1 Tax=Symbiodinium natans TaxID=878477 RepID=A0A812SM68_9DINO|nr:Abcb10 [Symbiodinium natans]
MVIPDVLHAKSGKEIKPDLMKYLYSLAWRCQSVNLLIGVALALALLNGLRAFAFHMARVRFVSRLRDRCFSHYMSQDMAFFDKVDAAELTSRLTSDCQMVFASLDDVLNFLLRSSSVTFLGSAALIRSSPRLALVAALVLLGLAASTSKYSEVRRRTTAEAQDAIAELSRVADEGLDGLATVRALGAEDVHRRLFSEQNDKILSIQKRNSYASGLFGLANVSLSGPSAGTSEDQGKGLDHPFRRVSQMTHRDMRWRMVAYAGKCSL